MLHENSGPINFPVISGIASGAIVAHRVGAARPKPVEPPREVAMRPLAASQPFPMEIRKPSPYADSILTPQKAMRLRRRET